MSNLNREDQTEPTIAKLQSDQFIIPPLSEVKTVYGDSREYEVDLGRQSCQCSDFENHRQSFPIGDPRRFCRHLIQVRSENLDDLPAFLQSMIEARSTVGAGMPNGSTFAFFEIDGRLCFFGENRDQTTYFFLSGIGGNVFYEFVYDRPNKKWLGETKPDNPDRLLVFAFKERGQYVTATKSEVAPGTARQSRRRRRRSKNDPQEVPSVAKYLLIIAVSAGLIAGGYFLFRDGTPDWLANLVGIQRPTEPDPPPELPSNSEMIETHKAKAAEEAAKRKKELEDAQANAESEPPPVDPFNDQLPSEVTPLDEDSNHDQQVETDDENQLAFRMWKTSDDQFSVSARYQSFMNGTVTLIREEDEKEVKIAESELCADDQTYLKKVRRERRLQKARQRKANSENPKTNPK